MLATACLALFGCKSLNEPASANFASVVGPITDKPLLGIKSFRHRVITTTSGAVKKRWSWGYSVVPPKGSPPKSSPPRPGR